MLRGNGLQVRNLRALAGAIHAGKADQDWFLQGRCSRRHLFRHDSIVYLWGVAVVAFAPGGVLGELRVNPYTAPRAAAPAATAAILMNSDRDWCCFAGPIAVPAGREAAPPDVFTP